MFKDEEILKKAYKRLFSGAFCALLFAIIAYYAKENSLVLSLSKILLLAATGIIAGSVVGLIRDIERSYHKKENKND